jgi:hypothetical protein
VHKYVTPKHPKVNHYLFNPKIWRRFPAPGGDVIPVRFQFQVIADEALTMAGLKGLVM